MGISMGGGGGRKIRSFNDINITPLTDIFLVLLIIMMVMAPMFQDSNKDIKIPVLKNGHPLEEQTVTVEVTKDGKIMLSGKAYTLDTLTAALKPYTRDNKDMTLTLRADADAQGDPVMNVFDAAAQAGFKKLVVAGDPEKAGTAQKSKPEAGEPMP
jgi:biopolymer transport protein ExbD